MNKMEISCKLLNLSIEVIKEIDIRFNSITGTYSELTSYTNKREFVLTSVTFANLSR